MLRFVRPWLLALATVAAPMVLPESARADVYVIESTVSAVKVGTTLKMDDTLTIPAGAFIRAVLPSGKTQTFRGPFNGKVSDIAKSAAQNEGVAAWVRSLLPTGGATEATPGATKSVRTPSPAKDCVSNDQCTPVAIFFGTNRNRQDAPNYKSFGVERSKDMTLGSAIVTVPKSHGRGQIERPVYWGLRDLFRGFVEDPARHFVIVKNGVTIFASMSDFVDTVQGVGKELRQFSDHAFVFVHGYNVTFDGALYRTAQIAYDLGGVVDGNHVPFGIPFLFSWPSKGAMSGYGADEDSARISVEHLRPFLEMIVRDSGAKNVHLIAHSMGNQIVLRVLEALAKENPKVAFNQIILAAPDVDKDEFEQIAGRIAGVATGITLYASSTDTALAMSRGFRDGHARAGEVGQGGPVVVRGIDSIDVSGAGTDFLSLNHDLYIEGKVMINDISMLLSKGLRPPPERTPLFEQRGSGQALYWVYPR